MNIIAEIGWNHLGNMDLAFKMIESAAKSGANTVKFQLWDPSLLKPGEWDKDGRKEIYQKAKLTDEQINSLLKYSKSIGINFLISVFGTEGAYRLKKFGFDAVKIPSHEIANSNLIDYCSKNFSYIFLSTGASKSEEVILANEILKKNKNRYNLMHCVSSYPCGVEQINLPRIQWLKNLHPEVGLSDHTKSEIVPSVSIGLGVSVIEKHFTTDNDLEGRDNKFAFNPIQFSSMVDNINETLLSLQAMGLDFQKSEEDIVKNYRGRWEPKNYI